MRLDMSAELFFLQVGELGYLAMAPVMQKTFKLSRLITREKIQDGLLVKEKKPGDIAKRHSGIQEEYGVGAAVFLRRMTATVQDSPEFGALFRDESGIMRRYPHW